MGALLLTRWQKRLLSGLILGPAAFMIIWKGGPFFLAFVIFCALICFYEWVHLALKTPRPFVLFVAGFFYIAAAFYACYLIRENYPNAENALAFIVMVWASDIGAYVMGKSIGGPKMSPNVSPNKTWAGFAGALIFPGFGLIACVLGYGFFYYGFTLPEPIFFSFYMIIGAIIGFVGQAGDLLISLLKRYAQVKDSGALIPGHGGLLDRVDAMMLAAPVFLAIATYAGKFLVS